MFSPKMIKFSLSIKGGKKFLKVLGSNVLLAMAYKYFFHRRGSYFKHVDESAEIFMLKIKNLLVYERDLNPQIPTLVYAILY